MIRGLLAIALWLPLCAAPQQTDATRFEQIKARRARGEQISAADREWALRYMQRQRSRGAAEAPPPRESTGLVPLPDLGKGSYQGFEGGLYPGGANTPPPAHLKAGLALAKSIVPLDEEGRASAAGKIVLLSIGMSNTTQEFSAFQKLAAADRSLNPKLVIVDGAQGGQTAQITGQPDSNFWTVVAERLKQAGVTARQVQAAWVKQANARPSEGFPGAARKLQADVEATLRNLHDKFPNLKIAYLSSRVYGGYATTPLNPEPYAYEGGFAMKWVIADRIAKGPAGAPWVAWGPYLWADGMKGRKQDSVVWLKGDLTDRDGTHPSDAGREKVARLLLDFLKTEPTARPWFTGR